MIEKIEIAVLDRLNQAFGNTKPALGYHIEKIDSYKAELSDFGTLIKNRRTAALVACHWRRIIPKAATTASAC